LIISKKAEAEKFVEIPCGVNHLLFKSRFRDKEIVKKYDLYDKQVILFVGALDKAHYFKGVNVLIQAIKKISSSDDFRVLIIGEGDMRSSYKSIVYSLGLQNKIIFAGFVPDNLLPKYYSVADMLVLPSIDKSEAFGIVSLEAMASGVAVIASDLAGVRSVVRKGETGLLVKPGKVDHLAEMISYLLKNPKKAKDFGKEGKKSVLKNYTWEKTGYKLEHVLKSIK